MFNIVFFGNSGASPHNEIKSILDFSPALWLDAADSTTITITAEGTNNSVSQWRDKSGNLRNVAQATFANQPIYNSTAINNLPAIVFDGVNDSLIRDVKTLPDFGVTFIVFRFNRIAAEESVIVSATDLGPRLYIQGNSGTLRGYSLNYFNVGSYTTSEIQLIAFEQVTGVSRIYRSGTLSGFLNNANGTNNHFIISRSDPTQGGVQSAISVSEIISIPDLSDTDRQIIEGYLAWKWGLVGSLPSTHPYKNTAPF